MSNLAQRLLLFFLGVPVLVAVIVLAPWYGHAALALFGVAFIAGCGIEIAGLWAARGVPIRPAITAILSALPPLAVWATAAFAPDRAFELLGYGAAVLLPLVAVLLLSRYAFVRDQAEMDGVEPRVSGYAFTLLYPGLVSAPLMLLIGLPGPSTVRILVFVAVAFANDSLAWATGMLFGRKRGIVAVSPGKSLAGFVGGLAGSILMAVLAGIVFPDAVKGGPLALAALGLAVGVLDILGDLFESALKRSARVKDSGSIVPGRGGFLDSFDNLLFAAPAFLLASLALGIFR
ncbi:MAG: phosphatidate cytidylyltransferase [Spirochaetales bacterium]|nr:phosphatidate cytidylyltransferase [Spirochaetales bacterium]